MQETVNTLKFANKAKSLSTNPIPAFLLESSGLSAAKKRKFGETIPKTPGVWNKTISTPTPSKIVKKNNSRRHLNATIGTPGKRARGEDFITPRGVSNSAVTSTVLRCPRELSPDSPNFSNLSGVSMIQYPDNSRMEDADNDVADRSRMESKTFSIHEITSVLSPYMRKYEETMSRQLSNLAQELFKKQSNVTPRRPHKPRMTSSPLRTTVPENQPLFHGNSADSTEEGLSPSETIISGSDKELPLREITNHRRQSVIDSGSPVFSKKRSESSVDIPVYDSPASTATLSRSPTMEEMERSLGIGPESPGALFCAPTISAPRRERRESRARTSRRTTMLGSEIETSLRSLREKSFSRRESVRPVRAAALGVFYGSPNKECLTKANPISVIFLILFSNLIFDFFSKLLIQTLFIFRKMKVLNIPCWRQGLGLVPESRSNTTT